MLPRGVRPLAVLYLFMMLWPRTADTGEQDLNSRAGWNMVMMHFLAQTNVYWVEAPLHLWLDVSSQEASASELKSDGRAQSFSSPTLQVAWLRAGDRAQVRPGQAFSIERGQVFQNLDFKSQQLTLQPSQLRAALERKDDSSWRLLLIQAVSKFGHVLAEDWLLVNLVERYTEAASNYGFSAPPMHSASAPPTPPPVLVHFVHLHLGKSHVEQLQAVSEGKKRSGSSASRATSNSSDCSLLFEISVRMAGRVLSTSTDQASAAGDRGPGGVSEVAGEILVHTNGLPDGPICRRIASARHVRLLHISAPSGIYGRPVQWHQHQADVIRMQALRRWGGIYLDTDALVLQPAAIRALLQRQLAVIGEQEEGGICNGVIIAPPFSAFIHRWTAQYVSFKDSEMGVHSSYYPMLLAKEHAREVMVLPPTRMHWPSFKAEGIKALWLANWAPFTDNIILHTWASSAAHLLPLLLQSPRPDANSSLAEETPGSTMPAQFGWHIRTPVACALSKAAPLFPKPPYVGEGWCDLLHPVPAQGEAEDEPVAFWPLQGGSGQSVWDLASGSYHGHVLRGGLAGVGEPMEHAAATGPRWIFEGSGASPRNASGRLRQDKDVSSRRRRSRLYMDGRGAVFLPLIGLFGANQLSVRWRARLGCCHMRCGTQVMWSMHTLKGWMLRAEISPDFVARATMPAHGAHSSEAPGFGAGESGGEARRRSMVWAEMILQRHPFQHVLASIGVPAALLGCARGGGDGEGDSDGDMGDNAWIAFSLSMSSHADEPVLFSASVGEKGQLFGEEGARGETSETRTGPVWRSWELNDEDAARANAWATGIREQPTQQVMPHRLGQHQCWFGGVLDKTFIHGCARPNAEDEPLPTRPGVCPLSFATLAEAVASCSHRAACGGITFSPRRGVYELRAGPVARTGSSQVDGEVSWLKSSDVCSGHLAVVPPQRCMTYSSPPKEDRRCNRWGAFLPFTFESGCDSRTFYVDVTGRPVQQYDTGSGGGKAYRDSLGNVWSQGGGGSHGEWQAVNTQELPGVGDKDPSGASDDLRAAYHDLNWIVALKGCSNDFWILSADGIAGVWLGSADSDERNTFTGIIEDFGVWNAYWSLESEQGHDEVQEEEEEEEEDDEQPQQQRQSDAVSAGAGGEENGASGEVLGGERVEGLAPKLERAGIRVASHRRRDEADHEDVGTGKAQCASRASSDAGGVERQSSWEGHPGQQASARLERLLPGWEQTAALRKMLLGSEALGGRLLSLPNAQAGEVDLEILWPSAFAILSVREALEAEMRYRLRVPAGQMAQGSSVQLEITFNNNVAGFQTPPTSRYGTFYYGKWPLANLRRLDAAESDSGNQDDLEENEPMWVDCVDKCTPKTMIGWASLGLRAVTESGQLLKTRVVWFKLQKQSPAQGLATTPATHLPPGAQEASDASRQPTSAASHEAAARARAAENEQRWGAMAARCIAHANLVVKSGCLAAAPAEALVHAVEALGVRSVLDLGAGVLSWLPMSLERLNPFLQSLGGRNGGQDNLRYHAVDVGGEALQTLMRRELFAEDSSVLRLTHQQQDVMEKLTWLLPGATDTRGPDAPSTPDLVIARGLLQHLSLADALQVFQAIASSGAKYALVTSSPHAPTNVDLFLLDADNYRPLNMLLPPFLPEQAAVLRTWADDDCRRLLVPDGGEWLGLDKPQELLLLDLALVRAVLV